MCHVGQVARPAAGCPTRQRISPPPQHLLSVATFTSRRLPHYHNIGQPIFLTWRLHGSLPPHRAFPATTSGQAFLALDRLLDSARDGPLYLARPDIANLVKESILHHETTLSHYQLHSWVIMANHVHLLVTPQVPVSTFMKSLKGFTAREANRLLHLTGRAALLARRNLRPPRPQPH